MSCDVMSELWSSGERMCKSVGTTLVNTKPVSEASGYLITSLSCLGDNGALSSSGVLNSREKDGETHRGECGSGRVVELHNDASCLVADSQLAAVLTTFTILT